MSLLKTLFPILFILSLLTMPANSQPTNNRYDADWKKVESLAEKGLPKSALEEVNRIYAKAKQEKQPAHLIKAILYRSTLQAETRENNEAISISEIENEISQSQEPVTSLLKSLLAETYWNYFSANRWKLYNRTETKDFKKADIATWTIPDFHRKISELFLQSISNEKILQATKLEPYNPIIEKGNVRHLRPTLYDLLAYRALDYFRNDERDISKPAYAFEINLASAFDPAADFVTRKFVTKDSLSLQHKALLTWQKLIAFHLEDKDHAALIDADLQRLVFVRSKSTHPDKEQLYFNAINHIAHQYGNTPAASQAWYRVAQYYEDKASGYEPFGDTTHRFARLKAKEICEQVLTQKDSSEGKINCYNLLNEISRVSLGFELEKVNTPGQPFRALVSYRNFDRLYLKLIRSTDELKENLANEYDEKFWPSILNAKPERTWEQSLPATNDMQLHRTEIAVDALPIGEYILVASSNRDFSGNKVAMGARYFYVSGISYVNNGMDFFVLDRELGKPLAKASVQTWVQTYDYKISKYTRTKAKQYVTDPNGFFRMEKAIMDNRKYGNYSYALDITHKSDRLFMNDQVFAYYDYNDQPKKEPKIINQVHFFLDRAIYRPGQTVLFKGIALNRNTGDQSNDISTGYETTVTLRDANYQALDSMRVKTNEFGSFNGSFRLPQGTLNGQFTLAVSGNEGTTYFRVEEYKRPKFEVDYVALKGTYQVNDTISVTGFAKAYAGNNIDGAIVKYRVIRQARFPYPWLSRGWWPRSQPMEIAHGEVTTDKDGKFTISFKAIPDLSVDRKFEPVFNYVITADVTDINGETQSGEKTVSAGYKSLLLKTSIPETMPADSIRKLMIRTENMNGEFEPSIVKVIITKLVPEKRLIRDRYWQRPDQFVMTKDEYIRKFPHDEYDNEQDFKNWAKGNQVFENADSSHDNGEWKIANKKFEAGFYQVEVITKDKNGQEVKTVNYTELFDDKSKEFNRPAYLWSGITQTVAGPGENAKVELGTSATDQFIILQTDKNKGEGESKRNYSFVTLNNEKKIFTLPVSENDRGGYGAAWMFVRHNRVYQVNKVIEVPWTNKELSIEYASFRDKTLPGSTETWKLKISGYKKDIVAAELLAGMYDASLDQFVPHNWRTPQIWPMFRSRGGWSGSGNFTGIYSVNRYINDEQAKSVDKRYDQLIWDDSNDGVFGNTRIQLRGVRSMAPVAEAGNQMFNATLKSKQDMDLANDTTYSDEDGDGIADKMKDQTISIEGTGIVTRKNFNETAFFFPDLRTDSTGAIEFSFTMPDALTRWKFMALAHTKDASFGYSSKEIVTQKELMVQPNAPRFLREGDKMEFSTKIANLSDKEMTGTVEFRLFDAATNEPVDGAFQSMVANQYFTVAAGQSEAVKFPIEVPFLFNRSLLWRIVAKSGNYSDGEENVLPVLTNRMLVTETLPLHLRGDGTKEFTFDKLLNSGNSETLQHHALTIEYSSNPAWYAIQALPYLMEYPYDCAEQTWNRYYANSLASYIAGSSPKIKAVFEQWKTLDTAALMSNLEKNPELKAILLEETPWVLAAKTESEQKRNIAMLFDMVKMSEQLSSSYEKLKQMQSSNGGFVWFKGGPDDHYMTQYIVSGIGHLRKLGAVTPAQNDKLETILTSALPYLDRKVKEQYDELVKSKTDLKKYTPGHTEIQYLYMRSFFSGYKIPAASEKAYQYFRERAQLTWNTQSKYMQGMTALALHRSNDEKTPVEILKSLKETSINNEELGMYWKNQRAGWFWYEAPVETQALLIEAFHEIGKDPKTVDDLRTWLLKNKQTNNWKTTKATAEACYALLLQGTDWLSDEPVVQIRLGEGGRKYEINSNELSAEKGTGYFKKTIDGPDVFAGMGKIAVTVNPGNAPAVSNPGRSSWGGVYWQYFEDLDKITTAATPLQLNKKLFVEKNTDRGPVITPINDGDVIKTGDKIKVRVELRVDRDMEYVHMKDMRASSLEPVNVLSSYKWQGGLGYYESTRDASTNFFFSYLRKGTYVFEYTLFATHSGNFSNGITTIQSMYAPEFTSHSEGIRIQVE